MPKQEKNNIKEKIKQKELQLHILYLTQATQEIKKILKTLALERVKIVINVHELSGGAFDSFEQPTLSLALNENDVSEDRDIDELVDLLQEESTNNLSSDLMIAHILAEKFETIEFSNKSNLVEIMYPTEVLKKEFVKKNKQIQEIPIL